MSKDSQTMDVNETKQALINRAVASKMQRDGSITARELVDMARPKSSAIHECFEWDDKVAGELHRQHQARYYLRRSEVEMTVVKGDTQEIVFESVAWVPPLPGQGREGQYRPVRSIAMEVDQFQRALAAANEHLTSARRAVEQLVRAAEGQAPDRVALVAQVSRGISIMQEALVKM